MDELLGGAWGRSAYVSRRSTVFSPNVDVYYCGDPQRAVVNVDLAGVDLDAVNIEISGRVLAIVGERPVQETEGRVYQQVEIPTGPFRRVVELQVDVDRRAGQGDLRGRGASDRAAAPRPGRDDPPGADRAGVGRAEVEGDAGPRSRRVAARRRGRDPRRPAAARGAAGPAAARDGHLPGDADPAGGRPGALDQAGRRRPRRQPDAGRWSPRATPRRRAGARRPLRGRRRRRRRPDAQGPGRDDPDPRPGDPAGAASAPMSPRSPTSSRGSRSCPTWSTTAPSCRR